MTIMIERENRVIAAIFTSILPQSQEEDCYAGE